MAKTGQVAAALQAALDFGLTTARPAWPALLATAAVSGLHGYLGARASPASDAVFFGYLIVAVMAEAAMLRLAFGPDAPGRPDLRIGLGGFQWTLVEVRLAAALIGVAMALLGLVLFYLLVVGGMIIGIAGGAPVRLGDPAELMGFARAYPGVVAGLALFSALYLVFFVWVVARLSLAGAMTVARGRVQIFKSWPLTEGWWKPIATCLIIVNAPDVIGAFVDFGRETPFDAVLSGLYAAVAQLVLSLSVGVAVHFYKLLGPDGVRSASVFD